MLQAGTNEYTFQLTYCQNIHQASTGANGLEKNMRDLFQQAAKGGAELASKQTKQWDQSRGLAKQLQNTLRNIRNDEVDALLRTVYGMREELVSNPCFANLGNGL